MHSQQNIKKPLKLGYTGCLTGCLTETTLTFKEDTSLCTSSHQQRVTIWWRENCKSC